MTKLSLLPPTTAGRRVRLVAVEGDGPAYSDVLVPTHSSLNNDLGQLAVTFGTGANTSVQGNDIRVVNALQPSTPLGGDLSGTVGAANVIKIGGVTPAASATVDATNANNILAGLLARAHGGLGRDTSSLLPGQIPIGGPSGWSVARIVPGSNITVTNVDGGIAISATTGAGVLNVINLNDYGPARNGTTDDSVAVAAAVADAEADNKALYVPGGGPIVLGGAVQVPLHSIRIFGDSWEDRGLPVGGALGHTGSVFWITDTVNTPFLLGAGSIDIEGINFYYPNQVYSLATPIVYPPLFAPLTSSTNTQAFHMRRCNILNCYDFLDYSSLTAKIGSGSIYDCRIWAIHQCLKLASNPEVIQIGSNCLFSPGAGSASVTDNLAIWHGANGTWLTIYGNGTSTVASTVTAGVQMAASFVFGCKTAIWVKGGSGTAGRLELSTFSGCGFDEVETLFQIDQYAYTAANTFRGNYINVQKFNNPSADISLAAVFINGALFTDLNFEGNYGDVYGTGFIISPGPFSKVRIVGNDLNVGLTTGGVGPYRFARLTGAATCNYIIGGNQVQNWGASATAVSVTATLGNVLVSGNVFWNFAASVDVETTITSVMLSGNTSVGTSGSVDVTGIATTNLIDGGNFWSKPSTTYDPFTRVHSAGQPAEAHFAGVLVAASFSGSINAASIVSGVLAAARLPAPTLGALGGVRQIDPIPSQYMTGISAAGIPSLGPVAASNVGGLAAFILAMSLSASQLTSGTVDPARLPLTPRTTLTGNQNIDALQNGKYLSSTDAVGVNWTLKAGVANGVGFFWDQGGAGTITFLEDTGVTIQSLGNARASSGQYGAGGAICIGGNVWRLHGAIA